MTQSLPLRRLVVAADGSAGGARALETGAELAAAAGAVAAVVTVAADAAAAERAVDTVRPQLARFPATARVAHHVVTGVPSIEIARRAELAHADLIVLNAEPGTVDGLLRRSRVPMLIVPAERRRGSAPGHPWHHILAALDGSPRSAEVLAAAFAVGAVFESDVLALHVEPDLGAAAGAHPRAGTMRHAEALRDAAEAAWGGGAAVAACDVIVRQGDPVAEIAQALHDEPIDLLVLGHDRTGARRSGVGTRLLARARIAVLVVPL